MLTKNNRATNATKYDFQKGEKVLVDTNVWLYLQPPTAQPTPEWAIVYSAVYKNLLCAEARPVIDSIVMSEYLNQYLRLEWMAWKKEYPKFKNFRGSSSGIEIAKNAVAELRKILNETDQQDTHLAAIDLNAVLKEMESGSLDFNDGILIENCRKQGWKLLTHDKDMNKGGIDVLTTNETLLSLCL